MKIQKPRKSTLGNDVENTFAKFHRNRSMGKVFKIGGKKSRKKEKKEEKCVLDPKIAFFEQSPNLIQIEF